jgi:hypothetical protein
MSLRPSGRTPVPAKPPPSLQAPPSSAPTHTRSRLFPLLPQASSRACRADPSAARAEGSTSSSAESAAQRNARNRRRSRSRWCGPLASLRCGGSSGDPHSPPKNADVHPAARPSPHVAHGHALRVRPGAPSPVPVIPRRLVLRRRDALPPAPVGPALEGDVTFPNPSCRQGTTAQPYAESAEQLIPFPTVHCALELLLHASRGGRGGRGEKNEGRFLRVLHFSASLRVKCRFKA